MQKDFEWEKRFCVGKIILVKNFLIQTNLEKKNLDQKIDLDKKKIGSEKCFGKGTKRNSKKLWVKKILGQKKILGLKIFCCSCSSCDMDP